MNEQWHDVEGFPGYAVSDLGNVMNKITGRLLVPRLNNYGKYRVALYRGTERHDFYIHHLVAQAFISGYRPEYQIRHEDGDGGNNRHDNLRFRRDHRLGSFVQGGTLEPSGRVRIVEEGLVFRTVEDCARYVGGDPSTIYRVLRGERLTHKGYTYEYVGD